MKIKWQCKETINLMFIDHYHKLTKQIAKQLGKHYTCIMEDRITDLIGSLGTELREYLENNDIYKKE